MCSKSKRSTYKTQILFDLSLCNPKRYSLFPGQQQKFKSIYFSSGSAWKGIFQFFRASRKPRISIICTALQSGQICLGKPPVWCKKGTIVLTGSFWGWILQAAPWALCPSEGPAAAANPEEEKPESAVGSPKYWCSPVMLKDEREIPKPTIYCQFPNGIWG